MLLTERIVTLAAAPERRGPAGATSLIARSRTAPSAPGDRRGRARSQRFVVAGLGPLRPRLVLAHVVVGGAVEQRQHLVLHRRDPVRDLHPLPAVPLLHVGGVVAVVVLAGHVDRRGESG